jgi:hypothetical protein
MQRQEVQDHKDKRYSGAQTAAAVWTPASGKRVLLQRAIVAGDGTGLCTLFWTTNEEGKRIIDIPAGDILGQTLDFGEQRFGQIPINAVIYFTTTNTGTTTVALFGDEVN